MLSSSYQIFVKWDSISKNLNLTVVDASLKSSILYSSLHFWKTVCQKWFFVNNCLCPSDKITRGLQWIMWGVNPTRLFAPTIRNYNFVCILLINRVDFALSAMWPVTIWIYWVSLPAGIFVFFFVAVPNPTLRLSRPSVQLSDSGPRCRKRGVLPQRPRCAYMGWYLGRRQRL